MVGTTGLKNLKVECVVGVYAHERLARQTVTIDVELDYDFAAPAASDALPDAVDYDRVAALIAEIAERRGFQLLEAMAEASAAAILAQMARVQAVRLEIRKPGAVSAADCAFVRLARARA
jgi:dihydroneopterin aldolase